MGTILLTSINSPTALRGFKASQSVWNHNWFLKDAHPRRRNEPQKGGETQSTACQYLWVQLSSDWEPWQLHPTAGPRRPHHSSWCRETIKGTSELSWHTSPWERSYFFHSGSWYWSLDPNCLVTTNSTRPASSEYIELRTELIWHWCSALAPPKHLTSNKHTN